MGMYRPQDPLFQATFFFFFFLKFRRSTISSFSSAPDRDPAYITQAKFSPSLAISAPNTHILAKICSHDSQVSSKEKKNLSVYSTLTWAVMPIKNVFEYPRVIAAENNNNNNKKGAIGYIAVKELTRTFCMSDMSVPRM